jgi:hypothetical protein
VGDLVALTITQVEETTGSALANVRFFVEKRRSGALVPCQVLRPGEAPRPGEARREPSAAIVVDEGDALPDEVLLRISPPSGPLTLAQAFDLVLVADTGGAAVTRVTGALDGQDMSGPLAACLQPAGTLTGPVTGVFLSCPGLSGGFLGPGAHTLAVTVALGDGRTLADTASWTVRP